MVHTHLFHADVVGRIAGILAGVPVIVKSLHNMGRWKPARYVAIDRFLNRWTDKVICCSDYQRDAAVVQERLDAEVAVTIPHGVPLTRFQPPIDRARYAAALGLQPGRLVVGTVGRLIPEKGHAYLAEAIPQILNHHPETEFLIVGDGPLRESLEARMTSGARSWPGPLRGRQNRHSGAALDDGRLCFSLGQRGIRDRGHRGHGGAPARRGVEHQAAPRHRRRRPHRPAGAAE